jgi:hypothetical protein
MMLSDKKLLVDPSRWFPDQQQSFPTLPTVPLGRQAPSFGHLRQPEDKCIALIRRLLKAHPTPDNHQIYPLAVSTHSVERGLHELLSRLPPSRGRTEEGANPPKRPRAQNARTPITSSSLAREGAKPQKRKSQIISDRNTKQYTPDVIPPNQLPLLNSSLPKLCFAFFGRKLPTVILFSH